MCVCERTMKSMLLSSFLKYSISLSNRCSSTHTCKTKTHLSFRSRCAEELTSLINQSVICKSETNSSLFTQSMKCAAKDKKIPDLNFHFCVICTQWHNRISTSGIKHAKVCVGRKSQAEDSL